MHQRASQSVREIPEDIHDNDVEIDLDDPIGQENNPSSQHPFDGEEDKMMIDDDEDENYELDAQATSSHSGHGIGDNDANNDTDNTVSSIHSIEPRNVQVITVEELQSRLFDFKMSQDYMNFKALFDFDIVADVLSPSQYPRKRTSSSTADIDAAKNLLAALDD